MSTVNIAGIPIIQFGDGVTGAIPPSGSPLSVKYYETLGLSGNLKAYTLTKASLTLSGYTLSVYNVNESSGGTGADAFDVEWLAVASKTARRNAFDELVTVVHVKNDETVATVFQIIPNARCGDVEQPLWPCRDGRILCHSGEAGRTACGQQSKENGGRHG